MQELLLLYQYYERGSAAMRLRIMTMDELHDTR